MVMFGSLFIKAFFGGVRQLEDTSSSRTQSSQKQESIIYNSLLGVVMAEKPRAAVAAWIVSTMYFHYESLP